MQSAPQLRSAGGDLPSAAPAMLLTLVPSFPLTRNVLFTRNKVPVTGVQKNGCFRRSGAVLPRLAVC